MSDFERNSEERLSEFLTLGDGGGGSGVGTDGEPKPLVLGTEGEPTAWTVGGDDDRPASLVLVEVVVVGELAPTVSHRALHPGHHREYDLAAAADAV